MDTNVISNAIRALDARSFDEAVQAGMVLVAFCEPCCAPCRLEETRLEELSTQTGTRVAVYEVNIDKEPELAVRFRIQCIPTLLLFKDGRLIRRFAGVLRQSTLVRAIQAAASWKTSAHSRRRKAPWQRGLSSSGQIATAESDRPWQRCRASLRKTLQSREGDTG